MEITREQVLAHRVRTQGLSRDPGTVAGTAVEILDVGVQDTGPDGAGWALAIRGARPGLDGLVLGWTLRGAPHYYRRTDLSSVVDSMLPLSHTDAGSRIVDAVKPLSAAGITAGAGLATMASTMRELVAEPMVKGDVSGALTKVLPEPYVRWCRPCGVTHPFEQTFRLGAFFGGLELEPGTSPPVLRRVPRWRSRVGALTGLPTVAPAEGSIPGDQLLLAVAQHLGPVAVNDLATFLDAPLKDVKARVAALTGEGRLDEVRIAGKAALIRPADAASFDGPGVSGVRLLGPYDLFLQARDRDLVVPDKGRHKELWPVLGRPGAVLAGGEVVGTWRPRASGRKLKLLIEPWGAWSTRLNREVDAQAELLAGFRGVSYVGRA